MTSRRSAQQPGERGEVIPEAEVNGVKLYYELHGSGEPLALVHGAWVDARAWRFVVPGLAENFRVLSYDRRGHSRSERPATQGATLGEPAHASFLPLARLCS